MTDCPKGGLPAGSPPPKGRTTGDNKADSTFSSVREQEKEKNGSSGNTAKSGDTVKGTGTRTGDDSHWLFWAAAMMVSLAGVIGVRRRAR